MNHDHDMSLTPHLSTRENLLRKILWKDKYWHNQLRKDIKEVDEHIISDNTSNLGQILL